MCSTHSGVGPYTPPTCKQNFCINPLELFYVTDSSILPIYLLNPLYGLMDIYVLYWSIIQYHATLLLKLFHLWMKKLLLLAPFQLDPVVFLHTSNILCICMCIHAHFGIFLISGIIGFSKLVFCISSPVLELAIKKPCFLLLRKGIRNPDLGPERAYFYWYPYF